MTPLSSLILHKLEREHVGMSQAIQRRELLAWLRGQGVVTTDRKLRYAVKDLGVVCMCERGYFLAANSDEARASIEYLKRKIFPMWEDIQNIEKSYLGTSQMELLLWGQR